MGVPIHPTSQDVFIARGRLEALAQYHRAKRRPDDPKKPLDRAITSRANALEWMLSEVVAARWLGGHLSRIETDPRKATPHDPDVRMPSGRGIGVRWNQRGRFLYFRDEKTKGYRPDPPDQPIVLVSGSLDGMTLHGWGTKAESLWDEDQPVPAFVLPVERLHFMSYLLEPDIPIEQDYPASAWDPN